MICREIILKNFRNIEDEKVTFGDGVNVLCGFNAQGKTNILEGIYYFALGKSFRGASDRELIFHGRDNAEISLDFTDMTRERHHSVNLSVKEKKMCRKEGIKVSKLSEFIGIFRAVLFSPEVLSCVKDGPAERRSFLDVAISQIYPAYMASLINYRKLLQNRNAVLKDSENRNCDELLYVLSCQMAEEAEKIARYRDEYTSMLASETNALIKEISLGKESVSMKYRTGKSREEYLKLLTENTEKEKILKTTLYGVHKDDLEIKLSGYDSRVYASQGQQRSIALSMKLAEGEISKKICGEYPVFLLDDIFSELDDIRKDYILSGLGNRQVIITCCEKIIKGNIYGISGGKISKQSIQQ